MIIHDTISNDVLFDPDMSRGMVPRDYTVHPPEMMAKPSEIPIIPRSQWRARIEEQEEQQSSLEHILRRANIKSKNQNQPRTKLWPYCWSYSTTGAVETCMVRDGGPDNYTELSAFGLAQQIMQGADKGGWCGLSAERIGKGGIPSAAVYPEWKTNWKTYRDDARVWEDAEKYKITYEFRDIAAGHFYFQNLDYDQLISCLLLNIPCPCDFDFWGHSVQMVRAVWLDGEACPRGRNSWGDSFGDLGFFTLQGSRRFPNSALAVVGTTAA